MKNLFKKAGAGVLAAMSILASSAFSGGVRANPPEPVREEFKINDELFFYYSSRCYGEKGCQICIEIDKRLLNNERRGKLEKFVDSNNVTRPGTCGLYQPKPGILGFFAFVSHSYTTNFLKLITTEIKKAFDEDPEFKSSASEFYCPLLPASAASRSSEPAVPVASSSSEPSLPTATL